MATETSELTPEKAVDEIDRLEDERTALSRRTAGLTWIVWGLVLGGLVMYMHLWEALGVDAGPRGEFVEEFQPLVALAWPLLGYLITRALWRSSGLTVPGLGDVPFKKRATRYALLALAAVGTPLAIGYLRGVVGIPLVEDAAFLTVLGGVTVAAGLLGVACHDRLERAVAGTMGTILLVAAVAISALAGPTDTATFAMVAPPTLVLTYTIGGLYLTTRG